jgi:2-polyprenyl-6-methoxyphenol hydroxylase-like FAD-dependent oxidoreductase
MTLQPPLDVLICGAGATGLTLAIELARRGINFRLIEKMQGPFQGSRGKGIQPRTQEIFEDLGILDRLFATGGLYPPLRKYNADGSYVETTITDAKAPSPAEPFQQPLLVPQFLTEAVLRERLAELGHRPVFSHELVGFEQDDQGVTAHVNTPSGSEAIRAGYLVGTDGGRSAVRRLAGIDFPGKTLGVRAVVADVELTGLTRDAWHHFNDGRMDKQLALCPLFGTELFQMQAPIGADGDVDLTPHALNEMIAARTGRQDIQVHSVAWASAYTMNARLAERYKVGRVILAGDAAHVHPPTGGQGLNTSVQDAYNLGWKLAAVLRDAPAALLDTYEEERRPIAAGMLGLSTQLLDAAKRGDMRRGRDTQQLDLGYPHSSLALHSPSPSSAVHAGDRAPDAPLLGAASQPSRLFELFKGSHWTLLGYRVQRGAIAPRPGLHIHTLGDGGDFSDPAGHFQATFAMAPGTWLLVRPDGYVGAVVNEAAALQPYWQAVGLNAR